MPRAEVLLAVRDAAPDLRPLVLVKFREQVLADCLAVLADTTAPDLAGLAAKGREAADVLGLGRHGAAQALASNVVDSALRLATPPTGGNYYEQVVRKIRDSQRCAFRELRRSATFWPVVEELQAFWPHKGDPVPPGYNRHACAHAVGDVQYTEANALIAVLLAASMLRELQQEHTDKAG